METAPAQLTVARQSPDDVGMRQIVVSLDGAPFATLRHGDAISRAVAPGAHRLRISNTLMWKNVSLDVAAGEHARFAVVSKAGWGTHAFLSTLGVGPLFLKVKRV